eukprot:3178-Heterococcus_DN1.PRE.3
MRAHKKSTVACCAISSTDYCYSSASRTTNVPLIPLVRADALSVPPATPATMPLLSAREPELIARAEAHSAQPAVLVLASSHYCLQQH